MLNNKLKAHIYGDYDLSICLIVPSTSRSRDKFDLLYSKSFVFLEVRGQRDWIKSCISLEQALLYAFDVTPACNMEHHLVNSKEVETEDEGQTEELELDLFRSQLVKIFGADPGAKSGVMLNDFRVLHSDWLLLGTCVPISDTRFARPGARHTRQTLEVSMARSSFFFLSSPYQ